MTQQGSVKALTSAAAGDNSVPKTRKRSDTRSTTARRRATTVAAIYKQPSKQQLEGSVRLATQSRISPRWPPKTWRFWETPDGNTRPQQTPVAGSESLKI